MLFLLALDTALTYPCVHITEQFIGEQEGTASAVETVSDVDSKASELAVEASQIKGQRTVITN